MKHDYIEVIDFLNDPNQTRNLAMKVPLSPCPFDLNGIWSGLRSTIFKEELKAEIMQKLEHCMEIKIKNFDARFHFNPNKSILGFPHRDSENENYFAGVIYLNESYPAETGTVLYEEMSDEQIESIVNNYRSKIEIVYNINVPLHNEIKQRFAEECYSLKTKVLKKRVSIEPKFNKMVCYRGNILHAPENYFGESKTDSRLTIAFFGDF